MGVIPEPNLSIMYDESHEHLSFKKIKKSRGCTRLGIVHCDIFIIALGKLRG